MEQEIERVRAEIFQLEMKGVITPRQKAAVENEIQALFRDAGLKRDALKIEDIKQLQTRLDHIRQSKPANLSGYLKELFGEGQRTFFTLFDIIGVILFLFPTIAQRLISDIALTRLIGGLIFFVSFLWANYILYKNYQG